MLQIKCVQFSSEKIFDWYEICKNMLEYEVVQHVRKVGIFRNYNLNM